MNSISRRRCFNHPVREASARCPECERFFCRECVTEHEDRVICSGCLKKLAASHKRKLPARGFIVGSFRLLCGIFVAWLFFRTVGSMLLGVPSEFHDGQYWEQAVMKEMGNDY